MNQNIEQELKPLLRSGESPFYDEELAGNSQGRPPPLNPAKSKSSQEQSPRSKREESSQREQRSRSSSSTGRASSFIKTRGGPSSSSSSSSSSSNSSSSFAKQSMGYMLATQARQLFANLFTVRMTFCAAGVAIVILGLYLLSKLSNDHSCLGPPYIYVTFEGNYTSHHSSMFPLSSFPCCSPLLFPLVVPH